MARRQDLLVETGPGELTGLKRWINGQGMDVPRAQRTHPVMGNPYISPITRGYLWVSYPKNPKVEHNNYR